MIEYTISTTTEELGQILKLQERNLLEAVSEEEQKTDGFVTAKHDFDTLKLFHDVCPHTIAKDGNKLVGYALSMHPKFKTTVEVLEPMFEQIDQCLKSNKTVQHLERQRNYIVMGQICVAKAYRGQGVFRKLYKTMHAHVMENYAAIITEVDTKNVRSLQAHYAVGFEDLGRYRSGEQEWVLLYLI